MEIRIGVSYTRYFMRSVCTTSFMLRASFSVLYIFTYNIFLNKYLK